MMLSKEKATPPKSDRPENSVLLSLKELRRLEDERVKAEADARRAQAEAERRAKAEAEQRTRDEETRRVREEEERRQRAEGERELREQESIEEQRQRHVQGRRFGRSAWAAAVAGATLFLAVGGGLAAWASRQHQVEQQALEREIARRGEQARAAQLAFDARISALEEKAHREVSEWKTARDQARILGDLQRQKQAIEAGRPRQPRRTAPPLQPTAAAPKRPSHVLQKPEIDDAPLGGLPAIKSDGF